MLLEKEHDKYNENHKLRKNAEGKMGNTKEVHQKNTNMLAEQRKKGDECCFCEDGHTRRAFKMQMHMHAPRIH